MKKRPLFAGCIVVVAFLACLLQFGGEALFASPALKAKPQLTEGETVYFKGKIMAVEKKEEQTVLTIKRAELKRTEGEEWTKEKAEQQTDEKMGKQVEQQGEEGTNYLNISEESLKSRGLLLYVKDEREFSIGETVLGKGRVQFIEAPVNPGQFHAENYYRAKGIDYRIFSAEILKSDKRRDWYLNGLKRLSETLKRSIEGVFDEADSGLMESILLGNKENLNEDIYSLYQLAGIAHLLAISGLHMGLAGRGFYGLLRKLGASFLLAFFLSMALLLSYGILTGMGASALRAFLMFGLAMFARVCGRSNDLLTSAALALLLMCFENPWILTQSGVGLSFGAVFAIGGIYPVLEGFFAPTNGIGRSLLLSFSIHLLTVPILCSSYFQISVYSIFLNLLVLPLMTGVFLSGVSGMALGLASLTLGKLAAFPAHLILKLYSFLAGIFLKLPGAVFLTGKPKGWQILLYYLILGLALLSMRRYIKKKKVREACRERKLEKGVFRKELLFKMVPLAICIVLPVLLCYSGKKGLTITMLDVGQGDGIYIKLPEGQSLFLDGGSSSEKAVGVYRIYPFLKAVREKKIDIWAISHGDKDHYSGFLELLEEVKAGNFSIGELWLPDVSNPGEGYALVEAQAKALGIPIKKLGAGMTYRKQGLMLTCLHPEAGYVSESENAYSTTLLLQYGSFCGLFTGDVEKGGEEAVGTALQDRNVEELTFLKVAHHGSDNSTTESFCEGLMVRLAFISAGKNNSYGHPSREVVERLTKKGTKLYSTIESGALTLFTNGETLEIREFKK